MGFDFPKLSDDARKRTDTTKFESLELSEEEKDKVALRITLERLINNLDQGVYYPHNAWQSAVYSVPRWELRPTEMVQALAALLPIDPRVIDEHAIDYAASRFSP
jgi:hypothetical protein